MREFDAIDGEMRGMRLPVWYGDGGTLRARHADCAPSPVCCGCAQEREQISLVIWP